MNLDRPKLSFRCMEDWEAMPGDAQRRHCTRCDRDVHDLSAMTREEALALLEREGRPCVRYSLDEAGGVRFQPARRASWWTGAAAAAGLALPVGAALLQTGGSAPSTASSPSAASTNTAPLPGAGAVGLSGGPEGLRAAIDDAVATAAASGHGSVRASSQASLHALDAPSTDTAPRAPAPPIGAAETDESAHARAWQGKAGRADQGRAKRVPERVFMGIVVGDGSEF